MPRDTDIESRIRRCPEALSSRRTGIGEFLNRMNHLRLQKYFSSSKEMLTGQRPAQDVGGISAELS